MDTDFDRSLQYIVNILIVYIVAVLVIIELFRSFIDYFNDHRIRLPVLSLGILRTLAIRFSPSET